MFYLTLPTSISRTESNLSHSIQNALMDSLGGLVYGNHARLLQEPKERKRERKIMQSEYDVLTKANSVLSNFGFARDV